MHKKEKIDMAYVVGYLLAAIHRVAKIAFPLLGCAAALKYLLV